jgi:hypothetical protein
MFSSVNRFLLGFLFIISYSVSFAKDTDSPPAYLYIQSIGGTLISKTNLEEITSWRFILNNVERVIYSTSKGTIFSEGSIIDFQEKNSHNPDIISSVDKSYIVEGNGSKHIYVFTSPYCKACKALWYSLRGKLNEYKVFWMPIHTDKSGNDIYQRIIDDKNPTTSLKNYVEYQLLPPKVGRDRTSVFKENILKMQSLNLSGTPSGILVDGTSRYAFVGLKELQFKGVID